MPRGPLLELEGDELVFNHKKTLIEEYFLSAKEGFAWARITISESGSLNIQSDYGSFSYTWSHMGDRYKKEFADIMKTAGDIPTGYLYDKIKSSVREGRVEVKETIQNIKNKILEVRSDAGLHPMQTKGFMECTHEEARDLWDALDGKLREWDCEISQDQFYTDLSHMPELKEHIISFDDLVRGYDDMVVTSYDRQAMAFCMYIAPAFADILQKELDNENGSIEQQSSSSKSSRVSSTKVKQSAAAH